MIASILSFGVSALIRTLRVRFEGEALPEQAIITFWHSRMLVGWRVSRSNAVAMVSKSKDGEYLSSILSRWKYKLVRGSSGKGGMEALTEAMGVIRADASRRLVITPDGPQGPPEIFKRGAFVAALELDVPLYFLEIEHKSKKILNKSWDKFEVPLPFSTVRINVRKIETSNFPEAQEAQNEYLQNISKPFNTTHAGDAH